MSSSVRRSAIVLLSVLLDACAGATVRDATVPMPSAHEIQRVLLVCDEAAPGVADAAARALGRRGFVVAVAAQHSDIRAEGARHRADTIIRLDWPAGQDAAGARRPVMATAASLDGTELWRGEVRVRRDVDAVTAGDLTGDAIGERLQLWRDDWPFGMVRGFDFN